MRDLLRAHATATALDDCRRLIVRAIEIGWLDADSLRTLLRELERGEDPVVEELRCEHAGHRSGLARTARIQLALLDDLAECDTAGLIAWLASLVDGHPERASC